LDVHERLRLFFAARLLVLEGVLKRFVLLPQLRNVLCVKCCPQFGI
jgi:hypothetical protein